MIYVSAQPDQVYFHWQVELYLYQFSKHGIQDQCYAIFGYRERPSQFILDLSKKYNIRWYKDTRDLNAKNYYIPSIRPHILKQFFTENSNLGSNVFYHDSDIFLVKVPKFELMLNDDISYVSDTISYIGYNYIEECGARYSKKYPDCRDLLKTMCECGNISEDLVKSNQQNSGGAQYLLKNIDSQYWEDVEDLTVRLYSVLKDYEKEYPIDHHIQSWTADMWAVLWVYWKRGGKTAIHSELDFSWATSSIREYYDKNIFHLAGVTNQTAKDKFFKGLYTSKNVFHEYRRNTTIFDHISTKNATYPYICVIKEYVNLIDPPKEIDQFMMVCSDAWSGLYKKDKKRCLGRPIWRSDKYIIFHNSNSWILTGSQYENEISAKCGGFSCGNGDEPYDCSWTHKCEIKFL